MVDVNYATTYTAGGSGYLGGVNLASAPTTSAVRLISVNTAAVADSTYSNVAIHR